MVLRLADALEIPLRERNSLLVAAGYAPRYFETGLAAPEMAQMRRAIDLIIKHQESYPAFVLDRHWEIRMSNQAAPRCTRFLLGRESTESNMMRPVLHPNGLRPVMPNWEETAGDLIRDLHNQIAGSPSDERSRELLAEVRLSWRSEAMADARDRRANNTFADYDLPKGRRRASVFLDLHYIRNAARRDPRRTAHRVLVPGGRCDG